MSFQKVEKHYPNSYLYHFLAMFFGELNEENIKTHIYTASGIEGRDYVLALRKEIASITQNSHEELFIEKMKEKGYDDFDDNWINIILESADLYLRIH